MSRYIRKLFQKKRWSSTAPITKDIGVLDTCDGQSVRGWALGGEEPALLLITKNGDRISEFEANEYRPDLFGIGYGDCAFEKVVFDSLADDYLNKKEITLNVQFKSSLNSLNGSPVKFNPRNIQSKLWCENNIIEGWVEDFNNPNLIFEVSVEFNRNTVKKLKANKARFGAGDGHGFSIDLEKFGSIEKKYIKLSSKVMGCEFPLTISDKEHANTLADLEVFSKDTKQEDTYLAKVDRCWEVDIRPTVIIPVYGGVRETVACICSVFTTKNHEPFDVIVIDDCGPNSAIRDRVSELHEKYGFKYVQNDSNLGFVRTANKGISLASGSDVILLNSDTVVTDGWIDNLRKAAYLGKKIATVTPMSNNASIFSYPNYPVYNDFPKDINSLPHVGHLFNKYGGPIFEVPTAHGFCMYIKAEAISDVGGFDEELWGLGYGEENDLSMRMALKGWSHVMATDTFVFHHGSVSFSSRAEALMAESLARLTDLYPEYLSKVQSHINKDPARKIRNEISKKIILESLSRKSVLIVRHNFSGGTEKAIKSESFRLIESGWGCYTLQVIDENYWAITDDKTGTLLKLSWRSEFDEILDLLRLLNLDYIDYHNVLQFSPLVRSLPDNLGIKYILTIHDYYLICPRLTLTDKNGQYCKEPDREACNSCIKTNGVYESLYMDPISFGVNISEWRTVNSDWVSRSDCVVVPNKSVIDRLSNYFEIKSYKVLPHEEIIQVPNSLQKTLVLADRKECLSQSENQIIVVGVIGAIGFHKGLLNLYELARCIESDERNVAIKIIGYTEDDFLFSKFQHVEITGKYEPKDLAKHLDNVDVVLFPGEVPETYCFALSEVLANKKRVIAMDIGAIGERLKSYGVGKVVQLPFKANVIFGELVDYAHNRNDVLEANLLIKEKELGGVSLEHEQTLYAREQ